MAKRTYIAELMLFCPLQLVYVDIMLVLAPGSTLNLQLHNGDHAG